MDWQLYFSEAQFFFSFLDLLGLWRAQSDAIPAIVETGSIRAVDRAPGPVGKRMPGHSCSRTRVPVKQLAEVFREYNVAAPLVDLRVQEPMLPLDHLLDE